MVDVFISYTREHKAFVQLLAEAVRREGYSVWWDEELPAHLSYSEVISEKISAAKAAIVVWSESAGASQWVRAEADLARIQKKLIQTSIDGRMPPMPFNQLHFVSIGDWRGEDDHPGWCRVKQSLEALVRGSGEPRMHTIPLAPTQAVAPTTRPSGDVLRADAGTGRLVAIAVVAILLLVLLVAGAYLLTREAPPTTGTGSVANGAAPPASGSGPRLSLPTTDAQFTQAAVIEAESADVRSGVTAQALVVARLNRGDVLTTFPQDGEWRQVRLADGRTGYIERERIRILAAADAAPAIAPTETEDDLQPIVPDGASGGQIMPFSSARLLSRADVADLSTGDLVLARNEIFARHGRIFRNPALRRHFSQFSWYQPRAREVRLSPLEAANVRLILREEGER